MPYIRFLKRKNAKGWEGMMKYIVVGVYTFLSVSGLVLFKLGSKTGLGLNISASFISLKIHWLSVSGLILYIFSFILYMGLIAKNNISQLVPISTGITYIVTLASSIVIFKERITCVHLIGSLLIIFGILLIEIKSI